MQTSGMNTIEPKVEYSCKHGRTAGQREELSEEDVQKINAHYKCNNAGNIYTLFILGIDT